MFGHELRTPSRKIQPKSSLQIFNKYYYAVIIY